MTPSRHRIAVLSIAAALLAAGAGYALLPSSPNAAHAQGQPAAAPVDVAPALGRTIVDWQRYSGRLEAIDRVDIRPLVPGTLTEVHFQDGALVKKGDVLFTIDPRPYVAEVDRATAQLAAAQARAAYTASDLARGQRLLGENAIAKRDFEEKQNAAREAAANLQAARAALESARLNLGYTRITAPVDGRVSRAEVTVGNVVNAGAQSVPLTTLVSVSRMYASFDVDEQTFLKYVNPSRTTGTDVPVQLGLANEEGYSREGQVQYVDNRLDTTSGTIRVRAVFDNRDGSLVPGLYARVRLGGGAPREAVLVDEKAIGTDQNKRYVLVLDDKNHAAYREVTLGANVGPLRVVEKGLEAGERIVVNGLQRVRPGAVVAPNVVSMDTAPQAVKTASAALQ
ncbi:efflux RND transporter periplasmic adaptor subunit [Bordetella pseudohinzii]|uniref:Efflux pump periplasmic linker BepF n=1 Tax=Bordetella pseudohinzii TaxID=1331258 RepID=A0A0J6BPV1_9BORD|nr:efflux RND transporter periplasmic adaptor subunit [Bordetella pseudohinzii]ANY17786.1 efflux transporter periplasmic adaptor subunit [Bordetella pseudohinzii]KMM23844.1 hemolysin secretion protein D [Bordetella pseudohinzii]KXA75389.1 efflux transporter periplasmic adaptor subunit [Bordetella pseudohinzii]KXA76210.1 efflux transporter periplasmic adaptor subunit [Bordetella pseudohinzii]CUI76787.1 Efflux pump periplasmic linker BepF [Bordetella pseudohinzii]